MTGNYIRRTLEVRVKMLNKAKTSILERFLL